MTPSRLFIAHEALEAWVAGGRAELDAEELNDRETNRRFKLREALRFLEEVTGQPDAAGLVGKVKDLEQVAAMGGEHMADSVILGDNAYRVQTGFMGTLVPEITSVVLTPPPLPSAGRKSPSSRAPREADDAQQQATLAALQKFFLNNVK